MAFFYDLGLVTSTMNGQTVPFADGGPSGITANTVTLPTTCLQQSAGMNAYQNMAILVVSGQGLGSAKRILTSSTAGACTITPWAGSSMPNTSSTVIVGLLVHAHDAMIYKAEAASNASSNTGTFRAEHWTYDGAELATPPTIQPRRALSSTFQMPTISSATTFIAQATSAFHCELKVVDTRDSGIGADMLITKVYVDTAPSGNMNLYACPSWARKQGN